VRTGLLVDLDGGLVVLDTNDLSNEVVMSNTDLEESTASSRDSAHFTYKLVHGTSNHVLGDDDRTRRRVSMRSQQCRAVR
jgi:hypothetical protein